MRSEPILKTDRVKKSPALYEDDPGRNSETIPEMPVGIFPTERGEPGGRIPRNRLCEFFRELAQDTCAGHIFRVQDLLVYFLVRRDVRCPVPLRAGLHLGRDQVQMVVLHLLRTSAGSFGRGFSPRPRAALATESS